MFSGVKYLNMTTDYLKNKIKNLPKESGVYTFKGLHGKRLYIGKAVNLKTRISSYLKTNDVRIQKMVSLAKSLEHIATGSDIEALILESQLIKRFRPPFNIVMRDDKQYAFVGFTAEEYPKIFITHQPTKNQNFIGPFTDVGALKITLRYLRRIFPYCTCKKPHNNYCLNYHIGKCPGICCLKHPDAIFNFQFLISNYKNNVKAIRGILDGKRVSLIKKLEKEMVQLAQKEELEKAIELRNKILGLKRVFENAMIIKNSEILKTHRSGLESLLKLQKLIIRIEGYDVSNIQGTHATGSMVTFINGQPDKNFYRKFKIYTKYSPNDTAMLKEILERRFKHEEWPFPDLVLVDGGKGQVNTAVKTLKEMAIKIQVVGISKNEHHLGHQLVVPGRKALLPLTKLSPTDKNLLLQIDSEAHRFAIGYYRKLHRKLFK